MTASIEDTSPNTMASNSAGFHYKTAVVEDTRISINTRAKPAIVRAVPTSRTSGEVEIYVAPREIQEGRSNRSTR